ncbi:MAG: hypothetical protein ACFFB3_02150 [Candidatus Hodarchaeota archaeon]
MTYSKTIVENKMALREMSKNSSNREAELRKDGWIKRSALDEPRLSEAVELYKSLGFEVKLEPAQPGDLGANCSVCYSDICDKFTMIYTRKKE